MKKIAVIAGDGIGKEVIPQAIKVIEAAGVQFDYTDFDLAHEDTFLLNWSTPNLHFFCRKEGQRRVNVKLTNNLSPQT